MSTRVGRVRRSADVTDKRTVRSRAVRTVRLPVTPVPCAICEKKTSKTLAIGMVSFRVGDSRRHAFGVYRDFKSSLCAKCYAIEKRPHHATRETTCVVCARPIVLFASYTPDLMAPVCSDRCTRELRNAQRRTAVAARKCESCGTGFTPPRLDGRYCSPACRQRSYRARALRIIEAETPPGRAGSAYP